MTSGRHGGEVERAEPDSEHHCSPVLRPYAVTTGDSERRRGGAQRRPPPPLGLSKAHIPARHRKGSVTCYRGASLIQVRLRGDVALAKVEQAAVPLAFTLTYPDNFPLYREDYKGHLEAFCDRMQRRWPGAAIIWKLEFKARKSGKNKGKIAPHYHLLVFGVPWRFRFKEERGESARLRRVRVHAGGEHWKEEIELNGSRQCTVMSVWAELPDGGEFPNGEVYGADSLKCWASRNWFGVVGSGDFAHYLAGTRVERLRTIKGAFAYAGKRYMAKKEEMPVMEEKPGRYWGVIGRQHLPLGKREDQEVSASDAVKLRRVMRRYRLANTPPEKRKFLRKSQLWSEDFTAKLFCTVEFWMERLPKLIGIRGNTSNVVQNSEVDPSIE